MQTVDATYQSIVGGRYIVEYKAVINGVTYGQSVILSIPKISSALFDKFSIGNAISKRLSLSVRPQGTIPPMSSVDMFFRVKNASLTSDWHPKGKYYIDVRKENEDGVLTLNCFDGMLKAEYTFMESGEWTPQTALAVVQMIATDIGVNVNTDTITLLTNDPKTISFVPTVGTDGTTGKEMLCYIGAMYGGNWIMDESGELKLVQLVAPSYTHQIGVLAERFHKSKAFEPIATIHIKTDEKSEGYTSTNGTGRTLEVFCPWGTQEIADDLLDLLGGYIYQPFEAFGANIDPACQLGDGVTVNGLTSVIFKEGITLDPRCADDISAPYEEEVNHEYPYRTPMQREIAKREEENNYLRSTITQSVEGIRIELTQYTDSAVEGYAEELQKYIRYTAEGLELGDELAETMARLTETKLAFVAGGDEKAYIGQDSDGVYKFFVVNGHIVNKLELGDHWDLVASGDDNDNRLTVRYRG